MSCSFVVLATMAGYVWQLIYDENLQLNGIEMQSERMMTAISLIIWRCGSCAIGHSVLILLVRVKM